jgi:hypothetical protein
MKRLIVFLSAVLVLPSLAASQSSLGEVSSSRQAGMRDFLHMQGDGASAAAARIELAYGEDGRLCIDLGIKRGPGAISKTFFSFARITTVAGVSDEELLKVEFPKKATETEKTFHVYSACLDSERYREDAEKDLVRVLVRQPKKKPQKFFVDYPEEDLAWALNLISTSAGMLNSQAVPIQ